MKNPDPTLFYEVNFFWPKVFPADLQSDIETVIKTALEHWCPLMNAEIEASFAKHPGQKHALEVAGYGLPFSYHGEPLFTLFSMERIRARRAATVVCYVDTREKVEKEKDRILAQAKAKRNATIIETGFHG